MLHCLWRLLDDTTYDIIFLFLLFNSFPPYGAWNTIVSCGYPLYSISEAHLILLGHGLVVCFLAVLFLCLDSIQCMYHCIYLSSDWLVPMCLLLFLLQAELWWSNWLVCACLACRDEWKERVIGGSTGVTDCVLYCYGIR